MKKFSLSSFHKSKISYLIALLMLTCFYACKKEETNTTISYARVINTVPALSTYYPFMNSNALSAAALPYGGATAYSAYATGSNTIKFTSENTTESLFTKTLSLDNNTYNSFYLINKPGALDGLTVVDDLSMPATDKAYVRFINLSPDAPALDLIKTGESTAIASNKAYKAVSSFVAIAPGTFTFETKETIGSTIKAISTSTAFVAGYHYDIICGGLINPSADTERAINLTVLTIK